MQYCSQSETSSKNNPAPTSSLEKYKLTVIGEKSFMKFVSYELLILFIMPIPGRMGKRLRQFAYKILLSSLGKGTKIEKDITFRKPHQITIGKHVAIAAGCSFDVKSSGGLISVEDHVSIGKKTILNCIAGNLHIKKNTQLGKHVRLGSLKGLEIGKECMIGDYVYISGAAHAFKDLHLPIIKQPLTCNGPTVIGDYVKIGKKVTITDGVHIGNDVTIAQGSYVNIDIPAGTYAAGVPVKIYSNENESFDE